MYVVCVWVYTLILRFLLRVCVYVFCVYCYFLGFALGVGIIKLFLFTCLFVWSHFQSISFRMFSLSTAYCNLKYSFVVCAFSGVNGRAGVLKHHKRPLALLHNLGSNIAFSCIIIIYVKHVACLENVEMEIRLDRRSFEKKKNISFGIYIAWHIIRLLQRISCELSAWGSIQTKLNELKWFFIWFGYLFMQHQFQYFVLLLLRF